MIAGQYKGHQGPARTFTPMDLWDLWLRRDGTVSLTLPDGHTVGLAVLRGSVRVNERVGAQDAQFVLLDRKGGAFTLAADSDASLLVLSGEPIDEPVTMHGPFVMNTLNEIRQAIADFRDGRFGQIPV